MSKYKAKTIETSKSVIAFIRRVPDQQKQKDSFAIIEIMKEVSGLEPKMWGPSIIGFGNYHYQYESGHEGDAPLAGFSPRKNAIVLYFASSFPKKEELLKKLGKYKASMVSCVYIKKLEDIDIAILKKLIANSIKHTKSLYN